MLASAYPVEDHLAPTHISLKGVQWPTFKELVAELSEDCTYRVTYEPDGWELGLTQLQPTMSKGLMVLPGVSWQTFKALLTDVRDNRIWRIAYEPKILEIRMPLQQHEQPKILLANFVEALADELEIEVLQLGALLLEREDLSRAIEPDTCFYIQNEWVVRGKQINLNVDPPPDLAIESDHTHASLDKHGIYAALGVPELWRYHQQKLEVYLLQEDHYQQSSTSLALPAMPIDELTQWLEQSKELGQRHVVRLFKQRIREIL